MTSFADSYNSFPLNISSLYETILLQFKVNSSNHFFANLLSVVCYMLKGTFIKAQEQNPKLKHFEGAGELFPIEYANAHQITVGNKGTCGMAHFFSSEQC